MLLSLSVCFISAREVSHVIVSIQLRLLIVGKSALFLKLLSSSFKSSFPAPSFFTLKINLGVAYFSFFCTLVGHSKKDKERLLEQKIKICLGYLSFIKKIHL